MKKTGNVAWFVPALLNGSGGHRTIFQNINILIKDGYNCDVYVIDDNNKNTDEELHSMINSFYGEFKGNVYSSYNNKKYDVCVATAYNTAFVVNKIDCEKKLYFIQDFEPYFFPIGTDYILAENTYKYNFYGITIGKWLSYKLENEFNLKTSYFSFCADLNIYRKLKDVQKEDAICFIFQPDKPRRCEILALKALQIVKKIKPNIKIYTYGSIPRIINNLEVEQLGIISIEECNDLYNKCKVGLCMSASNPSRIPFEMMAAGLPVVELYRENNLYDFPDDGVLLADSTPESIATSILKIIDDESLQKSMSDAGIKYMNNYPLEKGYKEFLNAFNNFFDNKIIKKAKIEKMYKKSVIKIDEKVIKLSNQLPDILFYLPVVEKTSFIKRVINKIKKIINKILRK